MHNWKILLINFRTFYTIIPLPQHYVFGNIKMLAGYYFVLFLGVILNKCISDRNACCVYFFILLKNEMVHDIFFVGFVVHGMK